MRYMVNVINAYGTFYLRGLSSQLRHIYNDDDPDDDGYLHLCMQIYVYE
jgi:hypothetical protein